MRLGVRFTKAIAFFTLIAFLFGFVPPVDWNRYQEVDKVHEYYLSHYLSSSGNLKEKISLANYYYDEVCYNADFFFKKWFEGEYAATWSKLLAKELYDHSTKSFFSGWIDQPPQGLAEKNPQAILSQFCESVISQQKELPISSHRLSKELSAEIKKLLTQNSESLLKTIELLLKINEKAGISDEHDDSLYEKNQQQIAQWRQAAIDSVERFQLEERFKLEKLKNSLLEREGQKDFLDQSEKKILRGGIEGYLKQRNENAKETLVSFEKFYSQLYQSKNQWEEKMENLFLTQKKIWDEFQISFSVENEKSLKQLEQNYQNSIAALQKYLETSLNTEKVLENILQLKKKELTQLFSSSENINFDFSKNLLDHFEDLTEGEKKKANMLIEAIDKHSNELEAIQKEREKNLTDWMKGEPVENFENFTFLSPVILVKEYVKNQRRNYSQLIEIFQEALRGEKNPQIFLLETAERYLQNQNSTTSDGNSFNLMIPSILKQMVGLLKQNEAMAMDASHAQKNNETFLKQVVNFYQSVNDELDQFSLQVGENFSDKAKWISSKWLQKAKTLEAVDAFKQEVISSQIFLNSLVDKREEQYRSFCSLFFKNPTQNFNVEIDQADGISLREKLLENNRSIIYDNEKFLEWGKNFYQKDSFVKNLQKFSALAQFIQLNEGVQSTERENQKLPLSTICGLNIFNEYENNFKTNLRECFLDSIYDEVNSVLSDPDFYIFYQLKEQNLLNVNFDEMAKVYFREKIYPFLYRDLAKLTDEMEELRKLTLYTIGGVVVAPFVAIAYGAKKGEVEKLESIIENSLENFASIRSEEKLFRSSFKASKKDLEEQITDYHRKTGIWVAKDHLVSSMERGSFEIWKQFDQLKVNKTWGIENHDSKLYQAVIRFEADCRLYHAQGKQFVDVREYENSDLYSRIHKTLDSPGDSFETIVGKIVDSNKWLVEAFAANEKLEKVSSFDSFVDFENFVLQNSIKKSLTEAQKKALESLSQELDWDFSKPSDIQIFFREFFEKIQKEEVDRQLLQEAKNGLFETDWTHSGTSMKEWICELFSTMPQAEKNQIGFQLIHLAAIQSETLKKQYWEALNNSNLQFQQGNMQLWEMEYQKAYKSGVNEWERIFSEMETIQNQWSTQFMETATALEEELVHSDTLSLVALNGAASGNKIFNELSAQALNLANRLLSDSMPKCNLELMDEFRYVASQNQFEKANTNLVSATLGLENRFQELSDLYEKEYLDSVKEKYNVHFQKSWRSLKEMIEKKDKDAGSSLTGQLIQNGFKREGNEYTRQTVTGMVLFGGSVLENQKIADYIRFDLSSYQLYFDESVLSSIQKVEDLKSITNAEEEKMKEIMKEIFGGQNSSLKKEDKNGTYKEVRQKDAAEFFSPSKIEDKYKKDTDKEPEESSYRDEITLVQSSNSSLNLLDQLTSYEVLHTIQRKFTYYGGKWGEHFGYIGDLNPTLDWAGLVCKVEENHGSFSMDKLRKYAFIDGLNGRGESDRILGDLAIFNLKENRGLSQFSTRAWDLRLWDDDWDFFKAPTLRETVEVLVSAIGAVASGGTMPWLGFALKAASDLGFAIADTVVAKSEAEKGKTWINFFSKTAVSAVSIGLSSATAGATSHITDAIQKGAANWGLSLVESVVPTLVSGATSGVAVKDGSLAWDSSLAINHFFGKEQLASFASTVVSSGVKNGLDLCESTGKINTDGYFKNDLKNMNQFKSFVGSTTGLAISSAMTQSCDLSVLNVSDFFVGQEDCFGGNLPGSGLLSLHLEKGKSGAKISKGGTALNVSSWVDFAQGSLLYDELNQISKNKNRLFSENQVAVKALASAARGAKWSLAEKEKIKQLIKGSIKLESAKFKSTDLEKTYACTELRNDKLVMNIDESNMGKKELVDQYFLAVIMAHELARDGNFTSKEDNMNETVRAVKNHVEIANFIAKNSPNFISAYKDLFKEVQYGSKIKNLLNDSAFKDYVNNNYDSGNDFWKMKDGALHRDGEANLYYNNNSEAAIKTTDSEAQVLVKYLGKKRAHEYLQLKNKNELDSSFLSEKYLKEKLNLTDSEIQDLRAGNRNPRLVEMGFSLKKEGHGEKSWKVNNKELNLYQECLGSMLINKLEQGKVNHIQIRNGYNQNFYLSSDKINEEGEYNKYIASTHLVRSVRSLRGKQGLVTGKLPEDRGLDTLTLEFKNIDDDSDIWRFNLDGVQSVDVYNQVSRTRIDEEAIQNEEIIKNINLSEEEQEKLKNGEALNLTYRKEKDSPLAWNQSEFTLKLVDGEYQILGKSNFSCVDRDQKTRTGLQGNTVSSSYDVTFGGINLDANGNLKNNHSKDYTFFLNNFYTADGDYVDKYGRDGQPGGRWLIHSDAGRNSDGCFIASEKSLKKCFEAMRNFGLTNAYSGFTFKGELLYKEEKMSTDSFVAQYLNNNVQILESKRRNENTHQYRHGESIVDQWNPSLFFNYNIFLNFLQP